MPRAQQMRNAFGDALLRQVEELNTTERDAILGMIEDTTLAHYRRAMPVGWSPMTLHMEVSDAIRAVLGPERNVQLWSRTMADLTARPLLSGFLKHVGIRLGVGPGTIYRQTARLWKHLCREIGDLDAVVRPNGTQVELRGFPAHEHQFICFVEGLHGCLIGLVASLGIVPEVRVVGTNPQTGDASYDITW